VALQGQWDALDPLPAVELVHAWCPLLPMRVRSDVLDVVLARLGRAVEEWDPRTAAIPIHQWVHPWLPLLARQFEASGLYRSIRLKLGEALRLAKWLPSDGSALRILTPWRGVFLACDLDAFLDRHIVPALAGHLRGLELTPVRQDFAPWHHVLAWLGLLAPVRIAQLVAEEFFPKFARVLHGLLHQPHPDYEGIIAWYQQWKDVIPEKVREHPALVVEWDRTLEIMTAAMEGEPAPAAAAAAPPEGIESLNAAAVHDIRRERFQAEQARAISRAAFLGPERSFREEVEEYALRHNVLFAPKKGLSHDGKPLYAFGPITCYLDAGVIHVLDGERWRPSSLEQVVQRSQAQARGRR